MHETLCNAICDSIAANELDLNEMRALLHFAEIADPTHSSHAAHIRDTIRDTLDDPDITELTQPAHQHPKYIIHPHYSESTNYADRPLCRNCDDALDSDAICLNCANEGKIT